MNDETYDEYIRNVLGYPSVDTNTTIENATFNNFDIMSNNDVTTQTQSQTSNTPNENLVRYYPEIYKLVYPMVKSKCQNVRNEITNEDLENMTDEIYNAIEGQNNNQRKRKNNEASLQQSMINEQTDLRENQRQQEIQKTELRRAEEYKNETRHFRCSEEKNETRQINRGLRDLIKILLIRELIRVPNRPGPRPPIRPRPPVRPPFGPGSRPGRPPFNREDDIYEN